MKTKSKLMPINLLIGIGLTTGIVAQTTNYVPKWNGSAYVNTVTPLFEDATNSRIGIGLTTPGYKLDVSGGDINIATSAKAYKMSGVNMLWTNGVGTSVFVGPSAGNTGATGANNTGVGQTALFSVAAGSQNTAVGAQAGYFINGIHNTAVGNNAMLGTIGYTHSGNYNTALGSYSLNKHTSGNYNTASGAYSMEKCTTGFNNVAIGYTALQNTTGGYQNVAVGVGALSNSTAYDNTAVGFSALSALQGGTNNVAVGRDAGLALTGGHYNTIIGFTANTGGANAATLSNATAIGSGATVTTNSTMILGDNSISVGIGYSGSALTANTKFDINYYTGSAFSSGPVYGAKIIENNTVSGSTNPYLYGVHASAIGSSSSTSMYNYGGSFTAQNANKCLGVVGIANTSQGTNSKTYGGYFNADCGSGGSNAYGVYATVGQTASSNIALYGIVTSTATNNYAGYFYGDVYTTGGTNSGNGFLVASDQKFKNNVSTIANSTNILKNLKPRSYFYDTVANNHMHFSNKKQHGFLAQEVQLVVPELVYTVKKPADYDINGTLLHKAEEHLAVNYDGFIALLVAGFQAQQKKIDAQDSINQALQAQINQILSVGRSTQIDGEKNAITVELSNTEAIVLGPAVPNPFAEQTLISFQIPEKYTSAQMLFYDNTGKLIKTVDINKQGKGQIYVFANDLSSGTYSYTLIVDGKVIGTKKMIKQ